MGKYSAFVLIQAGEEGEGGTEDTIKGMMEAMVSTVMVGLSVLFEARVSVRESCAHGSCCVDDVSARMVPIGRFLGSWELWRRRLLC